MALHATGSGNGPLGRGRRLEVVTREAGYSRHAAIMHRYFRVALLARALDELHRMPLEIVALIARELRLIDDVALVPALAANVLRALRIDVARAAILQIGLCMRGWLRAEPTSNLDAQTLAEIRAVAVLALLASMGMKLARLVRVAVAGQAIIRLSGNVVVRSIATEQRPYDEHAHERNLLPSRS